MNIQRVDNINFQAGMTAQMRQEIGHCDINKISKEFERHNVQADFKNNKVVAWCSLKCMQIIEAFNNKYGLNLALPNGIFLEDFNKLDTGSDAKSTHGSHITELYTDQIKNSDEVTIERKIFFNEHPEQNSFWDDIDTFSDYLYHLRFMPNDSFLCIFLHEFSHSIHMNHLIEKFGKQEAVERHLKSISSKASDKFLGKTCTILPQVIGDYSTRNSAEAVACDLSDKFIKNINPETFAPENNFMALEPYRELVFKDKLTNIFTASPYEKAIRKCWDGKI
ncbi:MAG: hypothetical protein MJ231_02105 [bacterium]|nr:hypothetical protein [bacterium]